MEVLFGFVGLIASVLNVCLFFKLWKMTGNVKVLKETFEEKSEIDREKLFVMLMSGHNEEAFQKLNYVLVKKLFSTHDIYLEYDKVEREKRFDKFKQEYIDSMSAYYNYTGYDIPDRIKQLTWKDIDSFGKHK